jgi:hypothetical protein
VAGECSDPADVCEIPTILYSSRLPPERAAFAQFSGAQGVSGASGWGWRPPESRADGLGPRSSTLMRTRCHAKRASTCCDNQLSDVIEVPPTPRHVVVDAPSVIDAEDVTREDTGPTTLHAF